MKKVLFFFLLIFVLSDVFSQTDDNKGVIDEKTKKKNGYFNITQFGIVMGNGQMSEQNSNYFDNTAVYQISPSLTMTNGGMIGKHFGLGIGVGYEIFDRTLFPFFADFRYFVREDEISPFLALKIGHAFSGFKKKHYDYLSLNHPPFWVEDVNFRKYGGFMFNPEMGVKIGLNEKTFLLVSAAYRFQKIKSLVREERFLKREWDYKADMNRLTFAVAFMFR